MLRPARGTWRHEALRLSERASLRELVATHGSIKGVTLPLPDADLFVSRLPAGSLALILLARHREKNSAMGDTMPRARLIQVKVAEQSTAAAPLAADIDHVQRDHSHSIWQTLLQTLAAAFGGVTAAERVAREGSNALARAIHDDGLVVFAELVDLSQDRVLQQHRGRDPILSMPDGRRSMLAVRLWLPGDGIRQGAAQSRAHRHATRRNEVASDFTRWPLGVDGSINVFVRRHAARSTPHRDL